jgi:hypothetical protein
MIFVPENDGGVGIGLRSSTLRRRMTCTDLKPPRLGAIRTNVLGSPFCGAQQVAEMMLVDFPYALARPFQVHLQSGLNGANEQQLVPTNTASRAD